MKLKSVKFKRQYDRSLFYFPNESKRKLLVSNEISVPMIFVQNFRDTVRADMWWNTLLNKQAKDET